MTARSLVRERLWLGLGRRVIILVLLAVLVTGGLIGSLVGASSRNVLKASVLSRNLATAKAAASLAQQFVDVAETSLEHLANGPIFSAAVTQRDVTTAEFHMQQLMQISGRFDSISLYTPEGIGWASGLRASWQYRGGSVADREWFTVVMAVKKADLGIPALSPATGNADVPYALPMLDASGNVSSVLVAEISLAALSNAIADIEVSSSAALLVMDRRDEGLIIADTQSSQGLRPVPKSDTILQAALAGDQASTETKDGPGGKALVVYTPVAGLEWTIFIREPSGIAFAPVNRATRDALFIIGGVLVAALLASIFLARGITSPLRRLARGAEEVAKGNLDYRIGLTHRDEIGAVSRAFDRMTEQLRGSLVSRDELTTEVAERKRAEEALRELAERQQAILAAVPDILMEVDEHHVYTWANPAGLAFFGDDVVGTEAAFYFEGKQDTYDVVAPLFDDSQSLVYLESWQRRKDGEKRLLAWVCRNLHDEAGNITGALSSAMDITDRRQAEEALRNSEELLRQSQKMEAVGQLAGGIAHDFNNLLTAVIGYSDLALSTEAGRSEALAPDLREIKRAAERASSLTRQILAFSRRQALQPAIVSLNDIVRNLEPLLRGSLGEGLHLTIRTAPSLALSELDVNQFEQVIMNLVLNARDATPPGGHLTVETDNAHLDEKYCHAHPEVTPGDYVMLSVSDTGVGMDIETLARIFEPFFTTKRPGEGTGLGLSTVYGIVRQSDGSIAVTSRPGKGTTFKVYLPQAQKPAAPSKPAPAVTSSASGGETILVVEDERALRRLVDRVLSGLGYKVLPAATAHEALELADDHRNPIHLLVTDVLLPGGMQGNDLARLLTAKRPGLPVLYMSGYTRDAIVHAGRLDSGVNYLQKPFTPETLAAKVREVLADHSRHAALS